MAGEFILAIDQGTTGSTATVINAKGHPLASANQEFPQIFPKPGWVEHNPEAIWQSVLQAIRACLQKAQIPAAQIAAIGITNQRETVVMWDKTTGRPLHNAIVWQCRRTTEVCERIRRTPMARTIHRKTGLVIDPYFSSTKIQWLLNNVSGAKAKARRGELCIGTIDSYVLWRLSGAFCTDVSNASRTQLMNIDTGQWDDELLEYFGVPRAALPEIGSSGQVFATTKGVPELKDGIPVAALIGDQQSALFGQACFQAGSAKCTYGTGSFILMNSGPKRIRSRSGLLTTVAWRLPGQTKLIYALEGGAFVCGAAVQWLRDGLQIIQSSSEIESLARQVSDTAGVEFVPALTGLGAPHWRADVRGAITGLTRGATRAHLARATLEAMALQNLEILRAMEKDLGKKMRSLKVDGGAAANNLLMQMQADFLNCPIVRPQYTETTSLGAAYMAGLTVGLWPSTKDIESIWQKDCEFKPSMKAKAREERLKRWQKAVAQLA